MTEFTKTKISFALALLGTLFALHPFMEKLDQDLGFEYLGLDLRVAYVYVLLAGLLAFTVYCYAIALVSERVHGFMERLGNYSYALSILVLPLYAALYGSHLLAVRFEESSLHWAPTAVAAGLGVLWLVVSQLLAWLFRGRLGQEDRTSKIRQLSEQEIAALNHARELFLSDHYDLAVIEAWKAIEARLRRVLLARGSTRRTDTPEALIEAAVRAGLLREPSVTLLQELRKQWRVAISFEPLSREAAEAALLAARNVLATISVGGTGRPE